MGFELGRAKSNILNQDEVDPADGFLALIHTGRLDAKGAINGHVMS